MSCKIFSIKYQEDQIVEYTPYFNKRRTIEEKTYLFEYPVIIDIIDNYAIKEDYLGIFSYKFPIKTHIFKKKLFWLMEKNPEFDVYGLCRDYFQGKYLDFTEKVHPGHKEIFIPLCNDLGLQVKEPKYPIYSNFFVMKTELYKDYVGTIIKPAIELLETKYRDLVWKDSNYKKLSKEELKSFTGLEHYTFHTFVLERLVNMYIETNGLKMKQLQ